MMDFSFHSNIMENEVHHFFLKNVGGRFSIFQTSPCGLIATAIFALVPVGHSIEISRLKRDWLM
jgi:hypothetical protein